MSDYKDKPMSIDDGYATTSYIHVSPDTTSLYTLDPKQAPPAGSLSLPHELQDPTAAQNQMQEEEEDLYGSGDEEAKCDDQAQPSSALAQDIYMSGDLGRIRNNIGTQPSAPTDTAKLNIRVEWTAPFPERWRALLEKALQSWLNSTLSERVGEKYNIIKFQLTSDQNHAEVEITPSKALDILETVKTATLTFKELNRIAVVHFLLDNTKPEPLKPELQVDMKKLPRPEVEMFVSAFVEIDKWPEEVQSKLLKRMEKYTSGKKLIFSGSLVEFEKFHRDVCEIVGGPEAGMDTGSVRNDPGTNGAPPALITPLHHYCYFSHAYKKEVDQIQDKFGVKIDAEVSVSVTAEDQTRPDSVERASETLTDLCQTSTTSLQSLTIPQTQLDSDIVKEVVRNIQSDNAKMMVVIAADGCMLSGPKNTISEVQNQLYSESGQEFVTSVDSGRTGKMETDSSSSSRQTSRTSELRTKSILMNETHWRLMKKRFEKHLLDIEQKYRVQFCDEHLHEATKVTLQSKDNQPVNHESHALRAFMQLYLEVVLSAVSVPEQERTVVEALERHRLVGVEDKNAEQSDPAYQSMDRVPGFDDEQKTLINTKYLPFQKQPEVTASLLRPETVQRTNDDQRRAVNEKESKKSKYKDDCPICMESFSDLVKLKCGHRLCRVCQEREEKSMGEICPVCEKNYGMLKGNQPEGDMKYRTLKIDLPGCSHCGTIEIIYDIPSGIQTDEHPNPGHPYSGIKCRAYLPDSPEGRQVLHLLIRAFDQRLIFTVGTSTTTGAQNTVIWNDIHHKTKMTGGPEGNGYPDSNYMKRVKEELKAKGIN